MPDNPALGSDGRHEKNGGRREDFSSMFHNRRYAHFDTHTISRGSSVGILTRDVKLMFF